MKKEEKIEVMFESILLELEKITKNISSKKLEDDIEDAVIEESSTDQIYDQLNEIKQRIGSINIGISQVGQINGRIDDLKRMLSHPEYVQKNQSETHHYFWFFPDLKGWISLIKRGSVAWIAVLMLILSGALNYYMGKEWFHLKGQDTKYEYLRIKGDTETITTLDSLWNIEHIKERIVEIVKREELKKEAETPQPTQHIKSN
ncbi:MAG: hypothetical protein ACFHWX_18070 [Bacteroidota bacterium]